MTFPDSHVTCPSCEAVVPWSPACINCGSRLPPRPPQNPFQAMGDKLRDEDNRQRAADELVEAGTTVNPDEEPHGRLAALILWRVRLLERLEHAEIAPDVFTELYSQYMDKTIELTQQYADIADQAGDAHNILQETRRQLEEKQERRARGELTPKEFMADYERLRTIIDRVQATINGLRNQRAALGIGGDTPDDQAKLKSIRTRLHSYSMRLPALAAAAIIPPEMTDIVRGDLQEMLGIFEASVDWPLEPAPPEQAPKLPRTFVVKTDPEPAPAQGEDQAYAEVTRHVKGHDDEVRRILRAIRLRDHVLILGPDGEGKTETLLRLQASLGGVYLSCSEETTTRELAAGYNPGAPPADSLYIGALARVEAAAPTLYLDNATRLGPAAQALLAEAMAGAYTSPLDGSRRPLPQGFTVVAAGTMDAHTQEAPDPSLLAAFGKVVEWAATPPEAVQALLARYALPRHAFDLAIWARAEAHRMRYLAPVSVKALIGFAREYHAYRGVYQDETRLRQLAADRLLRARVINRFGLEELEEARGRAMEYAWGAP